MYTWITNATLESSLKFYREDPNFFIFLKPMENTVITSRSNAAWEMIFSLSKQTLAEEKRLVVLILLSLSFRLIATAYIKSFKK